MRRNRLLPMATLVGLLAGCGRLWYSPVGNDAGDGGIDATVGDVGDGAADGPAGGRSGAGGSGAGGSGGASDGSTDVPADGGGNGDATGDVADAGVAGMAGAGGIGGMPGTGGATSSGGTTGAGGTGAGGTGVGGTGVGGTGVGGTGAGGTGAGGTGVGGMTGTGGVTADGGSDGGFDGGGGAICTPGTNGGHAYAFCSGPLSWSAAANDCALKGMHLVRIDDATENAYIEATAFVGVSINTVAVWRWLGATDQTVEGEWRWYDGALFWLGAASGTPQGGLYNNWASAQPNDSGGAEDCAAIQHNVQATWEDIGCQALQPYVCEQ